MKDSKKIDKMIYDSYEAKVKKIVVGDFGEELMITCNENSLTDFEYSFNYCFKMYFEYDKNYPGVGNFRELQQNQLPLYLSDWNVDNIDDYYEIRLVMWPLILTLSCKEVSRKEINLK